MSRANDPYNNALAEYFWSRSKVELLEGGIFLSVENARTEVFAYMEGYYNGVRRHSLLGYKSPETYEQEYELKQANSVCR